MVLALGLVGIPQPAAAITWYTKLCVGFSTCESRGYGNGGYSSVYKKSYWNMYGGHNCTNYVAYRLSERGIAQFTVPGRGNAMFWGEHARNKGYAVDSSPRKGDVAWWYDMGSVGHVALVESVNLSAGTVVVSEDHWRGDFDWRTYKISDITGFIHVGTPPSSSVDSPPATTPVTTDTPTISGTAEVGKKLTAKPGDWEKGATFAYQWLRDKKSIGGATKSTYTLTGDDLGAKITVKVTGSKKGFVSASKTSAATAKVAVGTLTATPVPTISGTPKVLKKLTADAGAWAPAGVSFSYQWLRDGEAIKGATGSSYVVADADLGSLLSVTVTGTKDGFTGVSTTSEPTAEIGPAEAVTAPTAPPKISGVAQVGKKLTAKTGAWKPSSVKPTYAWLRNGKPIKGATKSSYTLVADDLKAQISVVVTGAPSGYISASIASEATAAVVPGTLTATPKPKVTGTAKVLKKLTAKAGAWAPAGITLTYQWRRDGKSIAGATKSSYVLTAEDLGAKISVKVKGKKRGFTTVSKVSSSTARIAAPDKVKAPSAKPAVSGTARVGKKLTAKTAAWRTSGVTLSYTWRRDGKKIKAATASSYTLTADDLGKRISVKVTGARSGYASASKTSVETAKVAVGILSATPKPTISGTARVGEKLTATAGSWKPSKVTLSYSWTRDGVPIAGATKSSYVLKVEDLGAKIGVKVTGSKAGFTAVSTTATPTAKVRIGRFDAPTPTVSGRESVLATLTVDPGKWTPKDAALTVQWLRDGIDIAGAMGVEYVLTADDLDAEIGVKVTGTKEGFGPLAVTAVAVAAVGPAESVSAPTTKPTISGTVQVGKKVTAKAGAWSPSEIELSYQWLRDGVAIKGATKSAYTLVAADKGAGISVEVTGTADGYEPTTASSAPVEVKPGVLSATPVPTISGTAKVGKTLTAVPGTWAPATVKLSYQWLRDGAAIKGATSSTYTLVKADKGARLTVKVKGSKSGFTSVSKTSKETAKVA
jgi:surface antigen